MNKIKYLEKPESVSWDEIHECLWQAHSINREKGMNMKLPSLPGSELKKRFEGGKGFMYIAMDGDAVVGTSSIILKECNTWYHKGLYAYECFSSVLPAYNGMGIYKTLHEMREKKAQEQGCLIGVYDTHENNIRKISIDEKHGYRKVGYKHCKDHYNVVMARWFNNCPPTKLRCSLMFFVTKIKVRLKVLLRK